MHIQKYNNDNVRGIFAHVERLRDHYSNSSIDPARTPSNYSLAPLQGEEAYDDYKARLERYKEEYTAKTGRKMKKDTVTCMSVVCTLPAQYLGLNDERQKEFFSAIRDCVSDKLGADNLIWAEVHNDETTPHIHLGYMPEKDGRLNCKGIMTRDFLKRFHDDIDRGLRRRLDWYKGGLVNDDIEERMNSSDNMAMKEFKELKKVRDSVESDVSRVRNELTLLSQTAQETRARTVSPDVVERVRQGKGIKKKDLQDLVSLASRAVLSEDIQGERAKMALRDKEFNKKVADYESAVNKQYDEIYRQKDDLLARSNKLDRLTQGINKRIEQLEQQSLYHAQTVYDLGCTLIYCQSRAEREAKRAYDEEGKDILNRRDVVRFDEVNKNYEERRPWAEGVFRDNGRTEKFPVFKSLVKSLAVWIKSLTSHKDKDRDTGLSL